MVNLECFFRNTLVAVIQVILLIPSYGCTLRLTTDLSKIIGTKNPQQLMGSEEAQQIATKIGEGIGAKMLEGELLAEDMGKGLGKAFFEPQEVMTIDDPVSVDIIEKSGMTHIKKGDYYEAINSFKQTHNLPMLEALALLLFDKGNTVEAANIHNYLIEQKWSLRPAYVVAKVIEQAELGFIENESYKKIEPLQYNHNYPRKNYSIFETIPHVTAYCKKNTRTKKDMVEALRGSPVIIFADSYFSKKQHAQFLEILKELSPKNLIVGLEHHLQKLASQKTVAESLGYLPLFNYLQEMNITTFVHGPEQTGERRGENMAIDLYSWDITLVDKAVNFLKEGKQVVIIIGDAHVSVDHLPFLMEEIARLNPALVIQHPLHLTLEDILEGKIEFQERLKQCGVYNDRVLVFDNDFYLNTEIAPSELMLYLTSFNLDRDLKLKQKIN